MRNLILVLGDQLDHTSAAFDGFDSQNDVVWMAEVGGSSGNQNFAFPTFTRAVRRFVVGFHLLMIVSLFFEVTCIWCPFNLGTHRSRIFLHDAKLFMLADEP